jgi:hypothetical protein
VGVAQDALRDRPEHPSLEHRLPPSAHDDQLYFLALGGDHDLLSGMPDRDVRSQSDTARARARCESRERLLEVSCRAVDRGAHLGLDGWFRRPGDRQN